MEIILPGGWAEVWHKARQLAGPGLGTALSGLVSCAEGYVCEAADASARRLACVAFARTRNGSVAFDASRACEAILAEAVDAEWPYTLPVFETPPGWQEWVDFYASHGERCLVSIAYETEQPPWQPGDLIQACMIASLVLTLAYAVRGGLARRRRRAAGQEPQWPPVRHAHPPVDLEAALEIVKGGSADALSPGECVICLESLGTGDGLSARLRVCGHEFHRSCVASWLQRYGHHHCPVCRRPVIVSPTLTTSPESLWGMQSSAAVEPEPSAPVASEPVASAPVPPLEEASRPLLVPSQTPSPARPSPA